MDLAGRGRVLQPRRQTHRVPLRRIVHAQVVADLADHHFARVEAHADGELEAAALERARIGAELLLHAERGVARAPGMVLVRDRRPEQRHDAVTGELVDGAFEAMDLFGQDLEEAVEHPMPFLGVDLLGQQHRVDQVDEQHGDLFALAFEGAAIGEHTLHPAR